MLHQVYRKLPAKIETCFTPEHLLGPVAAEFIEDAAVAAFLFNPETSAFRAVTEGASIVLGRRGAGKSALIKAFMAPKLVREQLVAQFGDSKAAADLLRNPRDLADDDHISIWVPAPHEMVEVDRIVRPTHVYTIEGYRDAWRLRLWLNVVRRFIEDEAARRILPAKLREVYKSLQALGNPDGIGPLKTSHVPKLLAKVRANKATLVDETSRAIAAAKKTVLFLIDTIEEYTIRESAVEKIVAGLFYLAGGNNPLTSGCKYKIALPTEIYRIVENAGAPGKQSPVVEFIQWNSVDLERIAAHRLLIFASLNCPDFFAGFEAELKTKAYLDKSFVRKLWQAALGPYVTNEAGAPESPISYVMRHTLLLPRQAINTLTFAVQESRKRNAKMLPIDAVSLELALDRGTHTIAREVFTSYKHVYPQIADVVEDMIGYCDSEMLCSGLEKVFRSRNYRKYTHEYCEDFPSFLRAMIDCGIIGVRVKEGDRHVEGRFAFNYGGAITFSEKDVLLIHPAFSRQYLAPSKKASPRRAVMAFRGLGEEAEL